MKHVVRGLAAVLLTTVVGVVAPSPASAHTQVCVGQGTANTAPLYYPVLAHATTGPFTFNLGFGACVPAGALTAFGTLSGWCGQSNGRGIVGGGHSFSYDSAGSMLVIFSTPTAPNPPGSLVLGVAHAIHDVTSIPPQSCLTGATRFLVTGAVAMIL